jgi:hypothetical protein
MGTHTADNLTPEDFEPDGLFGSRGVSEEVARHEGAFARYHLADPDGIIPAWEPNLTTGQLATARARARRSAGLVMRRFAVPESNGQVLAETRPDRKIWSGKIPSGGTHARMGVVERSEHVARDKDTGEDVLRGVTERELAWLRERFGKALEVTGGGDHHGQDTSRPHVHVPLAKYLFPGNQRVEETVSHDHTEHTRTELKRHLYEHHNFPAYGPAILDVTRDGKVVGQQQVEGREIIRDHRLIPPRDQVHEHEVTQDLTNYARRLSSHPMGLARISDADRVFGAAEGCLKEAALTTAGEATFSWPSVSLWEAPELGAFALSRLVGKRLYIVCDSDWDRPDDDSVIRQVLEARDAYRYYGVDAHAAAPPMGVEGVCHDANLKHGVDDFLASGPCHGTPDDLLVIEREIPWDDLSGWIDAHDVRDEMGRRPREEAISRNSTVLRWVAYHAGEDGVSRVVLKTLGAGLQHELGNSSAESVKRAVRQLEAWGALMTLGIRERMVHHVFTEHRATGKMTVAPELRATTALALIREFEGR